MASKYKESLIKEEVMSGDDYEIYPRSLSNGQKDYSSLTIGDYLVIEPISIDNYSSFPAIHSPGWLCKNVTNGYYKIFTQLSLNKIYIHFCSDKKHIGMEYVSNDLVSTNLNPEQFRNEFLLAVEKEYGKKTDEFYVERYREYTNDVEKYVENVRFNMKTLKSLDKSGFEEELKRITEKYHFVETNDISSFKHCLYLVVLDEYKQFYVGKAETSLKNRMRKHWTAKIIPARHLWNGGFEFSRIKFDDFKMFDSTRIFVCDDIQRIIEENFDKVQDRRIEVTNTFGFEHFDEMDELAKAERVVINDSKCKYCLSDRTPLMSCPIYDQLEKAYGIPRSDLKIKHYLRLDVEKPYIALTTMWEECRKTIKL